MKVMVPGKIVTSAYPPDQVSIGLSMLQQKRKAEFFGTDDRLFPLKVAQKIDATPFTLILHGKDDTVVPVAYSIELQHLLKERFSDSIVDLRVYPGEHGFDNTVNVDEAWLREGLSRVTAFWLGE